MATIRVSGSLESVKGQLMRIAAIVRARKNDGWDAFLDDEVWDYFTETDDNVCDICLGLGSKSGGFKGEDVLLVMPDQRPINYSDPLYRHRYPNIHESQVLYPGLRGDCRCEMFWREPFMTLVNRLAREMEMVA